MNWSWLSFVVGVLVGWLIEWLIDYLFWRRRNRNLEEQLSKAKEKAARCADELSTCRAALEVAEASAAAVSTRAAAVAVQFDLEEQEAPNAVGQEIDPTEFSPEEGTQTSIEAGEFPIDEIQAVETRAAPAPIPVVEETPEPAPEIGEDVDPSEFSAKEADLAEGAIEGATEGEAAVGAATRAGGAIPVPLGGEETAAPEPQDLTKIEGIGPKVQGLLNEAGIVAYRQLADTPVETLEGILEAAGPHYRMIKPGTWPEQARLAAAAKWDELEALQDRLSGGRAVDEADDA
jgi:predicted flap endonuclease-1-like 5' DNA nuclease